MLRSKILNTLAALEETTAKGEKLAASLSGDINQIARRSAGASSQSLFATLGTGLGAAGAILLTLTTGVPFVIAAPILAAVGGAAGALGWRGRRGIQLEKELHYREMLIVAIRKQIDALPPGTPDDVVDDLWFEYRKVMTGVGEKSIGSLSADSAHPAEAQPPKRLVRKIDLSE